MAKVGKKEGGDRNRARAGLVGQQVGKLTGRANGAGAGSRRRQPIPGETKQAMHRGCAWPASLAWIGRQKLKLICFYFNRLQLSANILLLNHNLDNLSNSFCGVNSLNQPE